jgi:hypothetical protein
MKIISTDPETSSTKAGEAPRYRALADSASHHRLVTILRTSRPYIPTASPPRAIS